jgi:hypothetical protein
MGIKDIIKKKEKEDKPLTQKLISDEIAEKLNEKFKNNQTKRKYK